MNNRYQWLLANELAAGIVVNDSLANELLYQLIKLLYHWWLLANMVTTTNHDP